MSPRTIEISGENTRLRLRDCQLLVERDGRDVGRIPVDEIGLLILDNPQTTYTHWVISDILQQGGAVLFCGPDHLPAGLAVPLAGHHLTTERFRAQSESSLPTRKRLWQQIVRAKVLNQQRACRDEATARRLAVLADRVRSGDPDNIEAQAAQGYWAAYLPGRTFRRDREGPHPNPMLNYGYIVFRAAIARALAGAGFHPALGLHHRNRFNPFCLADDLLEPFRPLVDVTVRHMVHNGVPALNQTAKRALLELLYWEYETDAGRGPLFEALDRMVASLHRCYIGQERELLIPTYDLPGPRPAQP
jgi:CRISPR-associated protein Cas1